MQEGADTEAELPESSDRKEHHADGQTGEQNIQSDTAVELSGEVAEKDQAKEVWTWNWPKSLNMNPCSRVLLSTRLKVMSTGNLPSDLGGAPNLTWGSPEVHSPTLT